MNKPAEVYSGAWGPDMEAAMDDAIERREWPGIRNLPAAQYHAGPGVSKSQLDYVHECPALLEWSRNAPVDEEAKAAVNIGSAFHALLLEPERFAAEYVMEFKAPPNAITTIDGLKQALVQRDISFLSSASKGTLTKLLLDHDPNAPVSDALAEQWAKGAAGKIVLSAAEARKCQLMRDSVMAHPTARALIEAEGEVEHCHYWIDSTTGELCRSRPDKRIPKLATIVDVKTTADATQRGFDKSIHEYRYHVQDAYYWDGHGHTAGPCRDFLFLVVSTTRDRARYPVHVRSLPPDQRDIGRAAYKADLATYATCRRTGNWHGVEAASLPIWFLNEQYSDGITI
jgi:exodeoxyribonuclease VIII